MNKATNLGSCPVDPAFGTGVNVDQHQPFHQGGVVQLQKSVTKTSHAVQRLKSYTQDIDFLLSVINREALPAKRHAGFLRGRFSDCFKGVNRTHFTD